MGYRKFLKATRADAFEIDDSKIKSEARFDGKWVLQTDTELPAADVALKYKNLLLVESVYTSVYQAYIDKQLQECGNPRDPIERMLIEQMLIAHHTVGRLSVRAAGAQTAEEAKTYHDITARFLGEFRRCALALKTYRSPVVPQQLTVVSQHNVAESKCVA
jgi:hypothetical protein